MADSYYFEAVARGGRRLVEPRDVGSYPALVRAVCGAVFSGQEPRYWIDRPLSQGDKAFLARLGAVPMPHSPQRAMGR
jgi:hypothetical protein